MYTKQFICLFIFLFPCPNKSPPPFFSNVAIVEYIYIYILCLLCILYDIRVVLRCCSNVKPIRIYNTCAYIYDKVHILKLAHVGIRDPEN